MAVLLLGPAGASAAITAPAGAPALKPVITQPYYNKYFKCLFPRGWEVQHSGDDLKSTKTKLVVAARPGTKVQLSVQFFRSDHPKTPSPEAWLKAHNAVSIATRKKRLKQPLREAYSFERTVPGGKESVVVQQVGDGTSFFVLRGFSDAREFETLRPEFDRLLESFRYKPLGHKGKGGKGKGGAAGKATPAKKKLKLDPRK
ncbi:MAG: hypothetical protein HY925_15970 [Elusimicrobia bacterium]|nr:hypothetical protein [Elusimicrobiota bacterium]